MEKHLAPYTQVRHTFLFHLLSPWPSCSWGILWVVEVGTKHQTNFSTSPENCRLGRAAFGPWAADCPPTCSGGTKGRSMSKQHESDDPADKSPTVTLARRGTSLLPACMGGLAPSSMRTDHFYFYPSRPAFPISPSTFVYLFIYYPPPRVRLEANPSHSPCKLAVC